MSEAPPEGCAWLDLVMDDLETFHQRPPDWRDEDGEWPRSKLVETAAILVHTLSTMRRLPRPFIAIDEDGSVLISWFAGDRSLDVKVVAERAVSYEYVDAETEEQLVGEVFEDDSLQQLVQMIATVFYLMHTDNHFGNQGLETQ